MYRFPDHNAIRAVGARPAAGLPRAMSYAGSASRLGVNIAGGAALGVMAISGTARMIDQMANPNKTRQVMHESFARRQGSAGRNYSLGVDPTSGVRFTARYKRRF